jgi:uncharacterized protein YjgD (DUF1641 family)
MGQLKRGDTVMLYNFIFKRVAHKAQDASSRASMGLHLFTAEDAEQLKGLVTVLQECTEWAQAAQEAESPEGMMKILGGMLFLCLFLMSFP